MQIFGLRHVTIASILAIAVGLFPISAPAEDVKEDLASLESSKAALAKILSKAKAEGLIVRSPEKTPKTEKPPAVTNFENMDCSSIKAFNFPDTMPVPDDADITNVAANTLNRALYYVTTDYFAEATALLRGQDDLQALLLKEIIGRLDKFPLGSPTPLLDTYQNCESLQPWVYLANTTDLLMALSDAQLLKTVNKIEQLPPPLRENLATVIGVELLEQDKFLPAKRLWRIIEDLHSSALDNEESEGLILTPSMQYFLARLEAVKYPKKATARLKYLSERESEFKSLALITLKDVMTMQGTKPGDELETDLEGLQQQYSSSDQGRSASLALVGHNLEAKKLNEAIQITIEDLSGHDDEILKTAIGEIANFLITELESDDADVATRALNVYFTHSDLLSGYSDIASLQSEASEAALKLGLSEFVDEIYGNASKNLDGPAQKQIDRAKLYRSFEDFSDLKQNDAASVSKQVQLSPDLLPTLIDALIQDEKLDIARRYAVMLDDPDLKSAYLAKLSWMAKEWPLVATQSDDAQYSDNQIKLAQVLTQAPNVKAANPKALKSTLDDFIVSVEADLAAAQSYMHQSDLPQISEAAYE